MQVTTTYSPKSVSVVYRNTACHHNKIFARL